MLLVLNEIRLGILGQVYGENASYSDENDMKANVHFKQMSRTDLAKTIVYPLCIHCVNCVMKKKVMKFARSAGSDIALGQVEATSPLDPTNPYAASKAAAEMMAIRQTPGLGAGG